MPDGLLPLLLIGPVVLLLVAGLVVVLIREQHRRLRQQRERQQLLEQQNEELERQVAARTAEVVAQRNHLEQALTELRAAQTQLIHHEKLASLGELTAGIAHEIQNPLNFVNNFAEVSVELVQELAEEQQQPQRSALEGELAADLHQNLRRIIQHGQRAAAIVRSMLEHSRPSSGPRELTDLNALAEEYLQLAYQGIRGRHKHFAATLHTDFAPDLPLVEVVPQDIGRVLLNLFTNAFYALHQHQQRAGAAYQPALTVRTAASPTHLVLQVSDNGPGIPAAVRPKIFQPFFTTKPTGEGTGLGLSLSYDIVTKGHRGSLALAAPDGPGTTFVLELPLAGAPAAAEPATRHATTS